MIFLLLICPTQIYSHEEANRHSGTMVFLLGNLLSSIPFLFLVSILSSLVFYFLIGLRNEFSSLMYFVTTIFVCLLANEALMMVISYIWLETYKCTLTLVFLQVRSFFLSLCVLWARRDWVWLALNIQVHHGFRLSWCLWLGISEYEKTCLILCGPTRCPSSRSTHTLCR